jgi:hypothetical protein
MQPLVQVPREPGSRPRTLLSSDHRGAGSDGRRTRWFAVPGPAANRDRTRASPGHGGHEEFAMPMLDNFPDCARREVLGR